MEILFEEALVNDKTVILEMMNLFNEIDNYGFDLLTCEKNLSYFLDNKSLGILYLIKFDNLIIGYFVLTFGFSFEYKGRDAFIDELFIKEEYRNKGIGKITMDFIDLESKRLGINAIHLEVELHNSSANNLYISKGYRSNNRNLLTKRNY